MVEDESKDIESVRRMWDEHADIYDEWYETFEGAVEHYVDWELLKRYLPEDRDAKILDAASGTGRDDFAFGKDGVFSYSMRHLSQNAGCSKAKIT